MPGGRRWLLILLLAAASASPREAASPSACQAAAAHPAIAAAGAALQRHPDDLRSQFALADAWSDAGCFNDALQVLQRAAVRHPDDQELKTRLRVANSLVGEAHFFDDIDRANTNAKLKRASFRCTTLSDPEACGEALRLQPGDPVLLVARGDALVRAQRPMDAIADYRRAAALAPDKTEVTRKIDAAEAQLAAAQNDQTVAGNPADAAQLRALATPVPPKATTFKVARAPDGDRPTRRYSNAAPESRSH